MLRLLKHIDADGNEIVYDHDVTGRQDVVTDRNGNPTVYVYEDRGLVTSVTDPVLCHDSAHPISAQLRRDARTVPIG